MLTLCKTHWYLHMSELVEIVDSLENKISKLLHKIELLNKAKEKLENELSAMNGRHEAIQGSLEEWEEKYNSLKLANSMLGSDTNKTEAKLRINALIRELDYCIVQLAE
jgi:chromosome segregation ATPase